MRCLIAFGRRCELIVKLAEPKLVVTITNVTTGSGAIVSVFAVLSSPGPALCAVCGIASRTYLPPSTACVQAQPQSHTAPPTLPRLILGLLPGLVRTVAVLARSGRGVACVFNK